jgi:hypothetical protein
MRNLTNPPAAVRPARDLATLARLVEAAARAEDESAQEALRKGCALGETLKWAKEACLHEHVDWLKWLAQRGIAQQRANDAMRLFQNWDTISSLLPEAGNVGVRKALELLREHEQEAHGETVEDGGPAPQAPETPESLEVFADYRPSAGPEVTDYGQASAEPEGPAAPTRHQPFLAEAYHEAGHAVVDYLLGHAITKVTIKAQPNVSDGHVALADCRRLDPDSPDTELLLENHVIALFAGGAAERVVADSRAEADIRRRSLQDENDVSELLLKDGQWRYAGHKFWGEDSRKAFENYCRTYARDLVRRPDVAEAIEEVAKALLRQKTLTGKQLTKLLRGLGLKPMSARIPRTSGR